jgi:hypothetical protein
MNSKTGVFARKGRKFLCSERALTAKGQGASEGKKPFKLICV